ncbi:MULTISPECIES: ubiquinone biosynthesis accessory factor UbiJ [Methylotenera]|uniref:ubiquinone biosynthesis accessory factor UbiJ n=1 Tax=Methylotenera TaxID=359407 RepID=UPI0003616301|nr:MULTISPECIES: SCP2 sterol-binding domain-containing protein [Methylotenera]
MLKPLVTRFLQHITNQNNWSRAYLVSFAGKVVQFDFVLAKTNLAILEDGSLSLAGETAQPDAFIHIPPSLALRLLAKDEAAKLQIKIDGDTHLATELSKILQQMRWDIEEDLSHLVGDITASKLGETTQKVLHESKKQTVNLAEMLTEYWQEEKPVVAKKRHIEQFNHDVDSLKSDIARFEKKLQKLAQQIPITNLTES